MSLEVYVGNTNVIELKRLIATVDNTVVEAAAVEVTIVDKDGAEVAGADWPIILEQTEESPSKGDYRGILPETVEFQANKSYRALVTANAGQDRIGYWEIPFVARMRS
jgi:hypothetical protein